MKTQLGFRPSPAFTPSGFHHTDSQGQTPSTVRPLPSSSSYPRSSARADFRFLDHAKQAPPLGFVLASLSMRTLFPATESLATPYPLGFGPNPISTVRPDSAAQYELAPTYSLSPALFLSFIAPVTSLLLLILLLLFLGTQLDHHLPASLAVRCGHMTVPWPVACEGSNTPFPALAL